MRQAEINIDDDAVGIICPVYNAEMPMMVKAFTIHGKSRSKWLAYNMAMRARVFDDWTEGLLQQNKNALVLHIGCFQT